MIKRWIVVVSSIALWGSAANAARTFNFSYIYFYGAIISGNVSFTTTDNVIDVDGHNALLVTDVSGDEGGVAITGLAPSFPEQYGGADNYLFVDAYPPFSESGVSVSFADGHFGNFFYEEDGFYGLYEYTDKSLAGDEEPDNFRLYNPGLVETTAAVPEPTSWVLMVGGFGIIGGALRYRRRTAISFG